METIKLTVVSVQTSSSGTMIRDTTREVEFEGEQLAEYTEPGTDEDGNPTDTRGHIERLYRAADGRLIVHFTDWSHWEGEPDISRLHEVTEADLSGRGRFANLGREAGYGRPLTLDQALTPLDRLEYDEPEPTTDTIDEGEVPRCERCGKRLPTSTRPYYIQDGKAGHEVYLCEDCADSDPGEDA